MIDWVLIACLWFLAAPLMALPLHCCCCACDVCEAGTTQGSFQVEISGVVEDGCGECADFNAVFLFDQRDDPFCCQYLLELEDAICGVDNMLLQMAGFETLMLREGASFRVELDYAGWSDGRDCSEEFEATYTTDSGTMGCDWTAAIATVT